MIKLTYLFYLIHQKKGMGGGLTTGSLSVIQGINHRIFKLVLSGVLTFARQLQ